MTFYDGKLTPEEHEAKREAERMALLDYEKAKNTVITVTSVTGYDERENSVEVDGVEVTVRVLDTPPECLRHWCDEHLDPYWDVEPVGDNPSLTGLQSLWTYGPSYRVVGGVVHPAEDTRVIPQEAQ